MNKKIIGIVGLTSLLAEPSSATIVSGAVTGGQAFTQGATFVKLSVPFADSTPDNTVGDDTFQNPNLYGFDEDQNIPIASPLAVNILADGNGGQSGAGVVPAGSTVASHYVFFDPNATTTQIGTVTFDSDIFGVITSTANLEASDFLVNTGVTYLNPSLRGLEAGDHVTITALRTITVDWSASTPGDYVRVLTDFSPGATVPLPAGFWLFGTGIAGLIGFSKRKKHG
ncbi:MAG: VPLPA-CTERM sorting domain-containing protein [Gammaproteobacteria bacterium]